MKFSDYLIGNQGGQPMSSQIQTPIQPQQMQSIAPQQSMQSSVTDFGIKPNQSAPKKKAETFDVLGMLEKTNQFTQQAIKDNPAPVKREYSGRDKNIIEVKKGIEDSLRETHKLNTLLDMKKYVDDGATFEEVQQDFQDIPQEVIGQIYDELANKSKLSTILKMYPELDSIQTPKELSDKYSLQKDNALKQAGQFILDAKERSKEKGDISSNFLTQGFMGAVGGAVKGVGDLIQGGGGLVDKGIAGTQALIQGGEMEDYQALPNSTAEDLLDTASGVTSSLGALYAMPASILINSGIEALPEEGQRALSDSMDWLGDKIAKIPGLAQWMQSLPPERQSQFKQELAGAGVALLIGLKNKKNIITDPKTFLRENINPVAIAKNFNENVLGVPKAAGKLVEGAVNEAGNKISTTVKGAKGKLSTMTRGATDYAAKKLIDSKFKITKTSKDAIRKATGVEPSEFILENNIGGNNIDEMVENTKNMVDDAMQTKFQALSEVKELQPITQREKLIGQSIVKQAKGDIEEIYGKKFDEILEDEIVPELKEQFTIVKNIEKVINEKEISPLQLEALKSLYDIYNSHLKYDLTKKRVLGAAEKIRLGLQETIEGLGEQVGVDIKGLNKKIAGGKSLEKGLIQAGDRLDNNNLFGLSDSQTAILSSALGGGGLEVASILGVKSLFENIGLRNKIARSLYTKKTPDVGPKIPNNTSSVGTTARSNISKQFGDSDTIVNGSKPNIQVKTKGLSNLKDQGDMPKLPPKTPKELPANIDKSEPLSRYAAGNRGLTDLSDAIVDWNNKGTEKDRLKLLSEFDTEKGKAYLNEVIESIEKNNDGTITAYRTGKIGGNKPQSYTISEGMAKTFSNEGTDISIKNFGKSDNKDFGSLDTVKVKIDPKGIKGYSPFDKELLVDSKFVTTESKVSKNPLANLTPAKQKVSDTPLSNLKNPKKPVQSNTLVSKADEMGNKRYIDKIESTEKTKLPISESEMKRNNLTPIKNLKGENTGRYENKSLNQGASNRTIYSKEGDIVTFKKDDAYKIGYAIDNQIENNYTVPKGDIVTTDLYKSKDLQPLYDEARKYKTAEEFYSQMKKDFENYELPFGDPNIRGDNNAKNILNILGEKKHSIMGNDINKYKSQLRKIREEANKKGLKKVK